MSPGEELLALAVRAAREAGALVRAASVRGVEVAATKSSEVDVVTEADRGSEQLIRAVLLEARPDDAVLGEEGDDVAGTSGVRWVVDPIDGTVNFLYSIPQYAVSIAAEVEGTVEAGVVLDVAAGTEFTAVRGLGSFRDGAPLQVRAEAPLAERLVATGFSYEAHQRELQARQLLALLPRIRDVRRMGSCALDLCALAAGQLDGYLEEGVNLWDHAAGGLVAAEAGARVASYPGAGGRPLLLAAPEHGFEELRSAVAEAGYLAD